MLARKLRSVSGESIAEVLVAVLVVALASILFAGMVSASTKITKKSEDAFTTYINRHNALETGESSEGIVFQEEDGKLQIEVKNGRSYSEKIKLKTVEDYPSYFTFQAE